MSEKRFKLSEIYSNTIMDTENCINNGSHCRMYDIKEVVDLLNKQQDTIKHLEKKLKKEDITIKELTLNIEKLIKEKPIIQLLQNEQTIRIELEKENEQLKKKLESLQKVLHLVECVSDE